jgi:hypothetical protein
MKLKKYGDAIIAANRFKDKGAKKAMADGTIIVEIHGARLIRNVQMISDQDPYVIVTLQPEGAVSYRTKVAQFGGTDPDWGRVHDNVMTFELNGTDTKLSFEVWNENYVSEDDFIGGVVINLAGQASDRSFKRKSFNVDTGGNLILSIRHQSCSGDDGKWSDDAAPQRLSNASAKADSRKERRKRQAEEEQLKVEVLKGYNLQEATMLTEQEPYVMATMLPQREISRRTNCVETAFGEEQHSGTNPEWTQEHRNLLMLQVESEAESVLLEVWAQNSLGGDDLLGSAEVLLRDIPFLQNQKSKLKLDTGGELEVNLFRQAAMSNIVDQFIKELQVDDNTRKLRSLGALCTLAMNEASPECMFQRGAIPLILPLLQQHDTQVKVEAAKFFANLSAHDTSPGSMLSEGVVRAVVGALTEADLHTAGDMRSQTDSGDGGASTLGGREAEYELELVKAMTTVLMNVAADDDTPPMMVEEGVCQAIIPFLHVHHKVTEHCIRCLANLSYHADTPQVMVLQGVAGAIAPLLHSQTEQVQAFTAEALVNLSAHSETPVRMVEDKIVLMTLPLLKSRSGSIEMKLDIVQTLANLCYHKDTKVSMMEQGVCSAVLPLLQSESSELRSTCSEVLLYLSTHEEIPLKMLNEGVCAAMEPLLHSDNAELRSNCAQTIMNVVRPLAIRT